MPGPLVAFIGALGFSLIFCVPAIMIIPASLIASLGWFIYEITFPNMGIAFSFVISSLVIGIASRLTSRIFDWPLQPLTVIAIVPLVPGAPAFYAMQRFMNEDLFGSFEFVYTTFFSASGIVIGLVASAGAFKAVERAFFIRKNNRANTRNIK